MARCRSLDSNAQSVYVSYRYNCKVDPTPHLWFTTVQVRGPYFRNEEKAVPILASLDHRWLRIASLLIDSIA